MASGPEWDPGVKDVALYVLNMLEQVEPALAPLKVAHGQGLALPLMGHVVGF